MVITLRLLPAFRFNSQKVLPFFPQGHVVVGVRDSQFPFVVFYKESSIPSWTPYQE